MQMSNLTPSSSSSSQILEAAPTYTCGGTVAIIACAAFAAIIVSSALVLANVIALSIPAPLLIVVIAVSVLALGRLCCYIHKSLFSAPTTTLSTNPPITTLPGPQKKQLTADDPLTSDEKERVDTFCKCKGCSFKPKDVLNQDEQSVLAAWSKGLYTQMNECMAKKSDDPAIKHINEIAIKALSKLPVAPNQQSLIRGAGFNAQKLIELYPVGQKFTLDRFMSTTTLPEKQLPSITSVMDTRFYIKGITGKSIKQYSCHQYKEDEVLFAPGAKFLITDVNLNANPKKVFLQEVLPEAST